MYVRTKTGEFACDYVWFKSKECSDERCMYYHEAMPDLRERVIKYFKGVETVPCFHEYQARKKGDLWWFKNVRPYEGGTNVLFGKGLIKFFKSQPDVQEVYTPVPSYNNGKVYLDYLYDGKWLGCKVTKKQWGTYCGCIGTIRFHLAAQHEDTDDITIKGMTLDRYNELVDIVGPIKFVNSIKGAKCSNREQVTLSKLDIVNGKIVEVK